MSHIITLSLCLRTYIIGLSFIGLDFLFLSYSSSLSLSFPLFPFLYLTLQIYTFAPLFCLLAIADAVIKVYISNYFFIPPHPILINYHFISFCALASFFTQPYLWHIFPLCIFFRSSGWTIISEKKKHWQGYEGIAIITLCREPWIDFFDGGGINHSSKILVCIIHHILGRAFSFDPFEHTYNVKHL